MATRKQRKRREKGLRHEYVWVDDEGNEVEADGEPAKASSNGGKARSAPAGPGRTVQPPSWRKSFKRGAIFAPIMVATVMLLSKNLTFSQQLTQALFIVAVFIPFSYFLDRVFYRSFLKRTAKSRTAGGKSGG
jgi:hypothetical protein